MLSFLEFIAYFVETSRFAFFTRGLTTYEEISGNLRLCSFPDLPEDMTKESYCKNKRNSSSIEYANNYQRYCKTAASSTFNDLSTMQLSSLNLQA